MILRSLARPRWPWRGRTDTLGVMRMVRAVAMAGSLLLSSACGGAAPREANPGSAPGTSAAGEASTLTAPSAAPTPAAAAKLAILRERLDRVRTHRQDEVFEA